jgi:hypothetical protein
MAHESGIALGGEEGRNTALAYEKSGKDGGFQGEGGLICEWFA